MKKTITVCLLFISTFTFSQNTEWGKSDAVFFFDEALTLLSKYPLKPDQKESLAICYKDEIMAKFTKGNYNLKIEAELKRIRESYLNQCAKNLGLDLSEEQPKPLPVKVDTPKPAPVKETGLSVENLAGTWDFEGRKFTFTEGGTYLFEGNNKKCNGLWQLNKKTITLNPANSVSNKFALCDTEEFEVVSFSSTQMDLLKTGAKNISHLIKVK